MRIQRAQRKAERLEKIARDLGVIEEELANLKINLKKLTIDAVIKETEASMARILIRKQELLDEREQIRQSSEEEALRTLEEELADLEELWPLKPFELKKSILRLLTKRVVVDQMSTKFFQVLVEWRYGEWGTEQTYLAHGEGGRKEWEEEELARLYELYPGERDRFAIMRAFSDRSWRAIRHMADNLGLTAGKGRGIRFKRDRLEYDILSWRDLCWLEQSGLSARSLFSNEEGWLSSSS